MREDALLFAGNIILPIRLVNIIPELVAYN